MGNLAVRVCGRGWESVSSNQRTRAPTELHFRASRPRLALSRAGHDTRQKAHTPRPSSLKSTGDRFLGRALAPHPYRSKSGPCTLGARSRFKTLTWSLVSTPHPPFFFPFIPPRIFAAGLGRLSVVLRRCVRVGLRRRRAAAPPENHVCLCLRVCVQVFRFDARVFVMNLVRPICSCRFNLFTLIQS